MTAVKILLIVCIVLTLLEYHQCGRYGGTRRGGGGSRPHTTRRPHATSRPYSSTQRTYTSTYRSQGSTTRRNQYQSGTTPRNNYYQSTKTPNNFQPPPKPGATYTSDQGPQKIKIVNKYNYHYPGYYSLPVQNQAHPGYFYTPSTYSYGTHDTGSTALGFFLGYSLAKMTTPTYSHYSFYDGYRPRYDHYEVHHYYHNKDAVPQKQEIQSNAIVGCVGDSTTICPANTTSLCTTNGALMCVVSATSTVPCTENRQVNCVTSTIACVNNTAPECKNGNQNSTSISIPCISNAEVHGEVKYVNNTIVAENGTTSTQAPVTTSTQYPVTTTSTQYPITTMPARRKRDAAQNFCVTIVALPAKKEETKGEVFLKDAKFIVENFIESALGL